MALYEIITGILGTPPVGYEPIVYIIGGIITYRIVEMFANLFDQVGRF
jgi:hypothetical protein